MLDQPCMLRRACGADMTSFRRLVEEADFRAAQELFGSDQTLDTLEPKCVCAHARRHAMSAVIYAHVTILRKR